MSEPKRWTVDVYECGPRREVMLRDQHWATTMEIDVDGDLRVAHEVDSDSYWGVARNETAYFPMAKVIEFLRAAGYKVTEPAPSRTSGNTDTDTEHKEK